MAYRTITLPEPISQPDEEWRSIPGYDGLYDASSLGRIRSHHRGGKIKQPSIVDGYELVFMHGARGRRGHNVHRLVCAAFHGAPEEGMEAAHLDGNCRNNIPNNLAWTTHQENLAHIIAHGTRVKGESHPQATLSAEDVRHIWFSPKTNKDIAKAYDVSTSIVSKICTGKTWRHITEDLPSPSANRR